MALAVEATLIGPRARLTWQQFHDGLTEDDHGEWVRGEVVAMSPVSYAHNDVSSFLIGLLGEYARRRGGRVFHDPFLVRLGPDGPARVPDAAFLCAEHADRLQRTYLDGAPDVVVEVVSPESGTRDRGEKFYEYEAAGVPEYWLIDPQRRQAEFYLLGDDGRYQVALASGAGQFASRVLPGFRLEVEWLWQWPQPALDVVMATWTAA